jgi:hypothetical protein
VRRRAVRRGTERLGEGRLVRGERWGVEEVLPVEQRHDLLQVGTLHELTAASAHVLDLEVEERVAAVEPAEDGRELERDRDGALGEPRRVAQREKLATLDLDREGLDGPEAGGFDRHV